MISNRGRIFTALVCIALLSAFGPEADARSKKEKNNSETKYVQIKDGVSSLQKINRSNKEMADAAKQETINFDRAKKAIEWGELNIGDAGSKVIDKIGEPVITLYDEKTNTIQWIYKPGNATFFEKYKIYLIFDLDEMLIGWKIPPEWAEGNFPKESERGEIPEPE